MSKSDKRDNKDDKKDTSCRPKSWWKFIGKYPIELVDTYRVVQDQKEVTARMISDKTKIQLTNANNRLVKLYEMCLVRRFEKAQESGGKEYLYKVFN